jgi:hypothetical protein
MTQPTRYTAQAFPNEPNPNLGQEFGFGGGSIYRYTGANAGNVGLNNEAVQVSAPPQAPTTPAVPPTTPLQPTLPSVTKPTLEVIDENSIREETRKRMQSHIDAIEANFANLITQENVAGGDRLGQTRAVNARSGLVGSDFGAAQTEKTTQFNKQQVKALEDEKAAKIGAVLANIEDRASAEIKAKKEEALGKYNREQDEFVQTQENARADLEQLAKSSVDLGQFDPAQRTALFKQAGYEDTAFGELVYNAMKPKAAQIDYKFEKLADGVGLFYGTDPVTGELRTQKVTTPIPDGFTLTIAPDGTPILFNKNTGEARIANGFNEGQFIKPEDPLDTTKKLLDIQKLQRELTTRDDLLPTEKDRAIFNQIVGKFSSSPLIAASDRTIVLKNTVDAIKQNPGNAAMQLNLAYGYIQALDTYQSAVREGELANVNTIDSKIGQLQNYVQQMTSGQQVRPEVALQLAGAAQNLVDYISEGAKQKEEMFRSQARVNRIEGAWDQFRQGFETNYDNSVDPSDPRVKTLRDAGFTDEEIEAALNVPEPGDPDFVGPTFNKVGSDTKQAPKTGMRTDRHNNPTAFTVNVAKTAGLVEGKDYTVGDPFPNNPKERTARLLGDPIATTIKVIDKIGFYTQSGKPRWTYVNSIPDAKNWNKLSYSQKKNVIKQMYSHEGGKALLNKFA